jgi:TraK protein
VKTFAYSIVLSLLLSSPALAQDSEVLPERTTTVMVSARDVNRVRCEQPIEHVEYSKEKHGVVKAVGNDVFVKFLVRREGTLESYTSMPFDLHVICGGEVYTLILRPRDQDSTTIRLGNASRKSLQSVAKDWGVLPLEEKVTKLTRAVYRNEVPSNFSRTIIDAADPRFNVRLFKDVEVIGKQEVNARGTGLRAVEYALIAHKAVTFNERDFLVREMGDVVGVTIHPLTVEKEGIARLIVVQRSVDNGT